MAHRAIRQLPFLAIATLFLAGSVEGAQPQIVSLSPSSGSGQTQTFTLTVSDADGYLDVSSIDMLINSAFDKNQACWMYFAGGRLYLASDVGTWPGGGISAGNGTNQNSQCTVELLSNAASGNDVSFTVSVAFSSSWLGAKTIFGESLDRAQDDSGYQQVGTFTAASQGPPQDFSVSVTPSHLDTTPGHGVSYNFSLTSIGGFGGNVNCVSSANPDPSGLTIGGTGGFDVPINGAFNGQILAQTQASTPPTNNITITLACQDNNLQHSAQTTLNIAAPEMPTVAITPTSGSGSTQTFTISATDIGGFAAIGQMSFLISPSFDGTNACWLVYNANPNQNPNAPAGILALASDDTSSWSNQTQVDSNPNDVTPIFNSQCSVLVGPTTVSGSGDTLTLALGLTFTSSFTGAKNLYVRASDVAGPDSGYQQLGSFTTQAGSSSPDFSINATPSSQNVTGEGKRAYTVAASGVFGYSGTINLSVTGLPPNSTLYQAPQPIQPPQSTFFTVETSGTTPTGSYTLTVTGTDGTLTHSANVTLNVTGAEMPTLSVSPASGSGTSQTFTFTAADSDGSTPADMDILFNSTLNGAHACWIYVNQYGFVFLASDDGSLWANAGSGATAQNSQCTVASNPGNTTSGQLTANVTVTFNSTFSGTKNIYMYADNSEGGSTGGYQFEGNWTIP